MTVRGAVLAARSCSSAIKGLVDVLRFELLHRAHAPGRRVLGARHRAVEVSQGRGACLVTCDPVTSGRRCAQRLVRQRADPLATGGAAVTRGPELCAAFNAPGRRAGDRRRPGGENVAVIEIISSGSRSGMTSRATSRDGSSRGCSSSGGERSWNGSGLSPSVRRRDAPAWRLLHSEDDRTRRDTDQFGARSPSGATTSPCRPDWGTAPKTPGPLHGR